MCNTKLCILFLSHLKSWAYRFINTSTPLSHTDISFSQQLWHLLYSINRSLQRNEISHASFKQGAATVRVAAPCFKTVCTHNRYQHSWCSCYNSTLPSEFASLTPSVQGLGVSQTNKLWWLVSIVYIFHCKFQYTPGQWWCNHTPTTGWTLDKLSGYLAFREYFRMVSGQQMHNLIIPWTSL